MKQKEPYQELTKFKTDLQSRLKREFIRFTIIGFDELNVTTTKNLTKEAYSRLWKANLRDYRRIAREGRDFAYGLLTDSEKKRISDLDLALIIAFTLSTYNIITGYRFDKEWERKRMRYAEEILAAKEASDRAYLTEMSKKNANLLLTQSMQAGIEVEDEAIKTVFKKAGIKKGKWVAEKDDITCSVCRDRDGKIYPIDSIPAKPHYNCRCYIVPYRETDSESR